MQAVLLQTQCASCGTQNRMIISAQHATSPKCGKCGRDLFGKFAVIFGYLYILSNPGMPKLLKIGQTSGSIQRRIDQLSSATGVPNPFVIEAYFISQNPRADETILHAALSLYRRPGREFFKLPLNEALARCQDALHRRAQYFRSVHGEFREP
jgi:ribosomal protein S27AE